MAQARRDQNRIHVGMGVSSVDGTPLPISVDPVTGYLIVSIVDTSVPSAFVARNIAQRDQNRVPVAMGVNTSTQLPQSVAISVTNLLLTKV